MDNIKHDMMTINVTEDLAANRAAWRAATTRGRRPTPAAGNKGR